MMLSISFSDFSTTTKIFDGFDNIVDEEYNIRFSDNFKKMRELYDRLKSNVSPITDDELSYILTTLPLELFDVSEKLNSIKLRCEILKLDEKRKISDIKLKNPYDPDSILTKTEHQDYLNNMITSEVEEDLIVLAIYKTLIDRVESERTYAKELIMGAKKIWDSRRSAEDSSPIQVSDLPEYSELDKG